MKNYTGFDFVQLRCAVATGSAPIRESLAQAMETPIDFPSIDRALVPGDRVAIAVHESLPQAVEVITAIIDWLFGQATLKDLSIRVVLATGQETQAQLIRNWLQAHYPETQHPEAQHGDHPRVGLSCHDPDNPQNLEYIAASEQAEPIYLHRDLVEADFVIPVYRWLEPQDPRGHDPYVVLPAFSDRSTMNRHAKQWMMNQSESPPKTSKGQTTKDQKAKCQSESGYLAGIQFAIAALVNQEGQIASVISGSPVKVDQACRERMGLNSNDESLPNEKGFELVVVQLVDESPIASWSHIASAAHSAQRWLSPTGRIVIVAPSLIEVSAGIGILASDDPDEQVQEILLHSKLDDSFAAAILRGIQSRRSIYIQSRVDAETLESLGFASIRNPAELERLMHSAGRVGVMEY